MTVTRIGLVALMASLDAALLLVVGAVMWHDPPYAADAAVGKGLMAIGAAVSIPAVAAVAAWIETLEARPPAPTPVGRSDWDDT